MAAQNTYQTITTSIIGEAVIYPLTTIWTPPCESAVPFDYIETSTSCAPPEYSRVWYNYGYYSPGICPSGYTIGCTASSANLEVPVKAGETAMVCVPSNYECAPSFNKHAISVSGASTTSVPAFDIRWREEDLQFLETNPLTPGALATGSDTTASATRTGTRSTGSGATSSNYPTSSSPPSQKSSSFGAGPIAGVVIGVVCLLVAIGAVVFWMWRRRKQRSNQGLPYTQQPIVEHDPSTGPPELADSAIQKPSVLGQQNNQGPYDPSQQPAMGQVAHWPQQPYAKEMDSQPAQHAVSEVDGRMALPMANEMDGQPHRPAVSEMDGRMPFPAANEMDGQAYRPAVSEMDGRMPFPAANEMEARPTLPYVNEMDGRMPPPRVNEMEAGTPQSVVSELPTYSPTPQAYSIGGSPPAELPPAWGPPSSGPPGPSNHDWQTAAPIPATNAAPLHFYNNPAQTGTSQEPGSAMTPQTSYANNQPQGLDGSRELAELQERQAELQTRRRTLLELQQVQDEEERIRVRMQELQPNRSPG